MRGGGGKPVNGHQAPEPAKLGPSLEVPMGYGFRASVENGKLCIEQDATDDEGQPRTDNIMLAKHEAQQLIDWIASQVGEAA
jgi:hypothetical protein